MCYNLFVIVQSEYGRVAQLGERTVRIRKVVGSIPIRSTNKKAPRSEVNPKV